MTRNGDTESVTVITSFKRLQPEILIGTQQFYPVYLLLLNLSFDHHNTQMEENPSTGGSNDPSLYSNRDPEAINSLVVCFGEMLIDFVSSIPGVSLAEAPAFEKAPGGAPAQWRT
ncbi:hypothetical protein R6Q59_014225 [Mikania micrantha]